MWFSSWETLSVRKQDLCPELEHQPWYRVAVISDLINIQPYFLLFTVIHS